MLTIIRLNYENDYKFLFGNKKKQFVFHNENILEAGNIFFDFHCITFMICKKKFSKTNFC
jgi:hypothetical protein